MSLTTNLSQQQRKKNERDEIESYFLSVKDNPFPVSINTKGANGAMSAEGVKRSSFFDSFLLFV